MVHFPPKKWRKVPKTPENRPQPVDNHVYKKCFSSPNPYRRERRPPWQNTTPCGQRSLPCFGPRSLKRYGSLLFKTWSRFPVATTHCGSRCPMATSKNACSLATCNWCSTPLPKLTKATASWWWKSPPLWKAKTATAQPTTFRATPSTTTPHLRAVLQPRPAAKQRV